MTTVSRDAAVSEALVLQAVGARLWTAVVLLDDAGVLQYANPSAGRLAASEPSAMVGLPFSEFVHRDDRDRMTALFEQVCLGIPVDGPIAVRVVALSGEMRDVEVLATDLRDQTGVQAVMVSIRDHTKRIEADAELRHRATHDETTGLLNRAGLRDRAERVLSQCEWLSITFVAVSGLDRINDAYGRDHAERAAAAIADRLTAEVGDDVVGSLGNGEFVVIARFLTGPPGELAGRLRHAVESCPTPLGVKCHLEVTIGMTIVRRGHRTVDDGIRDAATAAHFARTRGGSPVQAFNREMRDSMQARMQLECDLSDALLTDTIRVGFQPVIELSTGRIAGAEALLRWTPPISLDPRSNAPGAPPTIAHVVEVAEEVGLIVPIGARTIEQVLEVAAREVVRRNDYVLSVNLSARQLVEPDFVDFVRLCFERTGAEPRSIAFELTETSIMTDDRLACRTLSALRSFGCTIGIDDFGTGWSSLSRVRDLPIDFIKIDQAFIGELDGSGRTEPVVAAMVGIANAFGLGTVAEGIETAGQAHIVAELGCQLGQGYLFGRAEMEPDWLSGST